MDNLNELIMEWEEMEKERGGMLTLDYTGIKRIYHIPKMLEIFKFEDVDEFYAYIQANEKIIFKISLFKDYVITDEKEEIGDFKNLYIINSEEKIAVVVKITSFFFTTIYWLYNNEELYKANICYMLDNFYDTAIELL